MPVITAQRMGAVAYNDGKPRAPVLNNDFLTKVYNGVNENTSELLEGYLFGWDTANLANMAETDYKNMPSVKTYNKLMENV